mgnify:CR=1 FL=1
MSAYCDDHPAALAAGRPSQAHPCAGAETAGNVVIPVISARPFNFDGVGPSSSMDLVVADAVATSGFESGHLDVRIHQAAIGSNATIEVIAHVVAPSTEDPGQRFQDATQAAKVTVTNLTLSGTGGVLKPFILDGLPGSFVTVVVRGTQGDPAGNCNAIVSADLVLRRRPATAVGGDRITLLPRTDFDYSSLGSSATDSEVLVRALDVSAYRTGFVALRVHDRSINSGAQLLVRIRGALPDPGDPGTDFIVPVSGTDHAFTIADGTTAELQTARLPSTFGPFLHVQLEATQSSGTGDLRAALSLDFVGQH